MTSVPSTNPQFQAEWEQRYTAVQNLKPYGRQPQTAIPLEWLTMERAEKISAADRALVARLRQHQTKEKNRVPVKILVAEYPLTIKWKTVGAFFVHWLPWRAIRMKPYEPPAGKPRPGRPMDPAIFTYDQIEPRNRLANLPLNGRSWKLLVNDTGLGRYFSMLVPDQALPQYVDSGDIESIVEFIRSGELHSQKVEVGYNSLGAGATVNSKHFQVIHHVPDWEQSPLWNAVDETLAASIAPQLELRGYPSKDHEMFAWIHRGMAADTTAKLFADALYKMIDHLQLRHIPFNLYFRLQGDPPRPIAVVVPRISEGLPKLKSEDGVEDTAKKDTRPFKNPWAFREISGRIVVEDPEDFDHADDGADAKRIIFAFAGTTFPRDRFNATFAPERSPTILVTGAAGFVGSNYVRYLLRSHPAYHIKALDSVLASQDGRRQLLAFLGESIAGLDPDWQSRLEMVPKDLSKTTKADLRDADRIAHLAAQTSVDASWGAEGRTWEANVEGTRVLLNAIRAENQVREGSAMRPIELLYLSTEHVYGPKEPGDPSRSGENDKLNPQNPYAISRVCAELLIQLYDRHWGVPAVIMRSSRMYGPGQRPTWSVARFVHNALSNQPLPVYGQGQEMRDKLYVDDGVHAIDLVLHKGAFGQVYNCSAGQEMSNLATARQILEAVDTDLGQVEHHPDDQIGRRVHDFTYRLDTSKIRQELGWRHRTEFQRGLRRTIDWCRRHLVVPSEEILNSDAKAPTTILEWPEQPCEPVDENRFLKWFSAKVLKKGHVQDWRFFHCRPAVGVVATEDDRIGLVGQWRYPLGAFLVEICKGFVKDNETPLAAAERELQEELGKKAEIWIPLGDVPAGPGIGRSLHHVFLAQKLSNVPKPAPNHDEGEEELTEYWRTLPEWSSAIAAGEVTDAVSIAAIAIAQAKGLI